ncbi:hypothetical protein [Corynebacterium coyleae]|uniref:hypothetical protein n=1 Tax=Corynebacterium coyleae TaxID=53374 RepID=UPI002549FD1F|nr:hypothetical protein [Corynebacterium coyleae]MDK8242571.1 hypothetical protein [Corynebacterium coyleae]
MTPAEELHDLARDLANAYSQLAELKFTPPRAPQARKMAPTFGPQTPSPDGDWALNLEHELMRETTDEHLPGGLRTIALDALGYTTAPPHPTRNCPIGYLDDGCTPAILCAHIARHARQIVDHFPAAEELAELMATQHAYLTKHINQRHGQGMKLTTMPADTLATGFGTAADLAPLISAVIGRHIDRKQITYWGRSGRITAYTQPDGTTQYRIDQTITAAREYVDKRTGRTAT